MKVQLLLAATLLQGACIAAETPADSTGSLATVVDASPVIPGTNVTNLLAPSVVVAPTGIVAASESSVLLPSVVEASDSPIPWSAVVSATDSPVPSSSAVSASDAPVSWPTAAADLVWPTAIGVAPASNSDGLYSFDQPPPMFKVDSAMPAGVGIWSDTSPAATPVPGANNFADAVVEFSSGGVSINTLAGASPNPPWSDNSPVATPSVYASANSIAVVGSHDVRIPPVATPDHYASYLVVAGSLGAPLPSDNDVKSEDMSPYDSSDSYTQPLPINYPYPMAQETDLPTPLPDFDMSWRTIRPRPTLY